MGSYSNVRLVPLMKISVSERVTQRTPRTNKKLSLSETTDNEDQDNEGTVPTYLTSQINRIFCY
jgi:hypothetical protein